MSCRTTEASLGGLANRAGRGVPAAGRAVHRRRADDPGRGLPGAATPRATPHPGSPLAIHRLRDPRAGDAYVLVLPRIVLGYQVLGEVIVAQAADVIRA